MAVMDRFFYSVPGLRAVAKYVAQTDRPLSFKELVQHFEKLKTADLVVFPEGSNCFFGDPSELQPFRSHRFVEIGILTKTPLLLCVHRGSEKWGKSWKLPMALATSLGSLFGSNGVSRLTASGRLTIPMWPAKMDRFSMRCELYQPEGDPITESEKVHARMQEMLRELDASN